MNPQKTQYQGFLRKQTENKNMAKGNNAQKKEKKKPKQENSKSSQKGSAKKK